MYGADQAMILIITTRGQDDTLNIEPGPSPLSVGLFRFAANSAFGLEVGRAPRKMRAGNL
jgi:hypothetical protein